MDNQSKNAPHPKTFFVRMAECCSDLISKEQYIEAKAILDAYCERDGNRDDASVLVDKYCGKGFSPEAPQNQREPRSVKRAGNNEPER